MHIKIITIPSTLNYSHLLSYLPLISKARQEKISNYQHEPSKITSLLSELLIRYTICHQLHLKNTDITFFTNSYRKLFLQNVSNFQFSLSHSQNGIAFAFHHLSMPIGIDIEEISAPHFDIAKRFFTQSENDYIHSHQNPTEAFYEIWTQKEAYVKMKGTGFINISPSDFDVTTPKKKSLLFTQKVGTFMVSLCREEAITAKPDIEMLSLHQILTFFTV